VYVKSPLALTMMVPCAGPDTAIVLVVKAVPSGSLSVVITVPLIAISSSVIVFSLNTIGGRFTSITVIKIVSFEHDAGSGNSIGIFAFTYTFNLIIRLFEINAITRQIEESFLNARPITLMLEEELEVEDIENSKDLQIKNGSIEFKNLTFKYQDNVNENYVFKNLNITIKQGEKIGLVGPSGGGKTTLTKLVLRYDDIQSGNILIDGQDIAKVTQRSLRKNIGYVPQEPLLFHRTIEENIKYGKPSANLNEIIQSAARAQADKFIEKLPNKYKTVVGERGIKLSGGQRQRIAIARAILKNAPILVLDEATSALDSESEAAVQESLVELMKDKTTIVIAHRLSTIQKMDRIIVLDEGKIVEEGSHKDLIKKKNGLYARLWEHQSGGFLQD
jgi:ATP-binding cassette subfamily B protein